MGMFEQLESRRMFASMGTWTPLVIYGTGNADVITLSQSGNTLNVVSNGVGHSYQTKWVSGIGTTPGTETYSGLSKVVIYGYAGNDVIQGSSSVQLQLEIYGGAGVDSITGGGGNDKLYGGSNLTNGISEMSADSILGGNGNDNLYAAAMSGCTLIGGAGNDVLTGGNGNDFEYGGSGNDWVIGGAGDDFVQGETGSDLVWGGTGVDTCSYQYVTATTGVVVKLDDIGYDGTPGEADNIHSDVERVWGSKGNDIIWGSSANNLLAGDTGADQIHGGGGNDSVYGDAGNDKVWGDAGDDLVSGGDGNDSVYGGEGADFMYGDAGSDTLISIGGGADVLWGGAGTIDSFWTDQTPIDTIGDVSAYESSHDAVHRVTSFTNFKYLSGGTTYTTNISKDLNGQNIPDPVKFDLTHTNYKSFADHPLFNNGTPSMNDIDQAGGGSDPADCWYMAVLSAAAMKNANFIKQRIVELGDGTYAIRVWKSGSEKFIRMDGDLPFNGSGDPKYAGYGTGGSIWVAMMEKAMAAFRDVRPANNGGTPNDTSDDFAGDPQYAAYQRVAYGTESEAWKFLGSLSPAVKNPSNLSSASQRAQWAIDQLNSGHAVTVAWGGHVRTVEGAVYSNGMLTALKLRDPYDSRYDITVSDVGVKGVWFTSAAV